MADIKLFNVVEVLGNLIQNNISDPAGKSKWVFPTFPEKDSNLPQVTVKLLSPQFEDDSAGSFLTEDTSDGYKEYYYKKATVPVNLYIITGKKQSYTVGTGADALYLTNQPLNIYITNQIKELLWREQENKSTFQDTFERVKVLGIDPTFRDTEHSWASEIQCEIKYKDVWVKEYENDELVASYSLTVDNY